MVQIVVGGKSRTGRLSEALGQSLGEGLGEFIGSYLANKDLQRVLDDKSLRDRPLSERHSALESALRPHGERGQKMLMSRLQAEQLADQEKEQSALADIVSGKEISPEKFASLSPETQLKAGALLNKKKQEKTIEDMSGSIKNALIKANYPEETADLWAQQFKAAPVGGQTDVIKHVNNLISRSKSGKGFQPETKVESPQIEIPGIETTKFEMDFPELPEPIGLNPSDLVKQQEGREKVLSPLYAETIDTLNALDEDYRDLVHLQELDQSGKLSSGIEKWNVDWNTGDLRVPALGTPEEQSYVKTIYRMLGHAKDFFPGRVTNFDLESFRRRFPTLANSPEGRKMIAKELELANRIGYLREETLKSAIEHYGPGADPIRVRQAANENYRRIKGQLESQLKSLNQQSESMYNLQNKEGSTRMSVYDTQGNLVGDIDSSEIDKLPQGYSVK